MKKYLLPAALFIGIVWDILFWEKVPGISYPVFMVISLTAGYFLLRMEKHEPSPKNIWLFGLVLLFSALTFIRKDIFTRLTGFALSFLFALLLSATYMSGKWLRFNLVDYIRKFLHLLGQLIALPLEFLYSGKGGRERERTGNRSRLIWQIGRGLLLAIPILIVFILLLSSADMVFEQRVEGFLQFFNLDDLVDFFVQGLLALIVASVFIGLVRYAEIHSAKTHQAEDEKPFIKPFLGFTEGATVLASMVILFGIFVLIQFRYFFSGALNITDAGFTYSEYARRGFGELILVAVFSLLLIQGIRLVMKIESGKKRKVFIALAVGLVLLVLVILASSFQRLLLYEDAYGFTSLRIYSHVFIIWLGLLLVGVILLELFKNQRFFANSVLLAATGFALTLNLLNPDAVIVRQNIRRAEGGKQLDAAYLALLSCDAVPQLVREYQSSEHSAVVRDEIGAALACQDYRLEVFGRDENRDRWQSFHFSDWRAGRFLDAVQTNLDEYEIKIGEYGSTVVSPEGVEVYCNPL